MSEETKSDVQKEMETPPDSSTENKTPLDTSSTAKQAEDTGSTPDSGAEVKTGEEPRIPKHRFDEVNDQMKRLEQENKSLQDRFNALGNAITGDDKNKEHDDIESVSRKHGIQSDFIKDVVSVAEKRASEKFEKTLSPYKNNQILASYESEVRTLEREQPDASYMSDEDREELKKMAFDKKYLNVPVGDLYKIVTFGRPQGHDKTIESSRSGAGRDRNTGLKERPNINEMSIEEFEVYCAELEKSGNP